MIEVFERKKMRNYRTQCTCGKLDFSAGKCRLASRQFPGIIAPEDRANLGLRRN